MSGSSANCPGVITVDEAKIGIMPGLFIRKVWLGWFSRRHPHVRNRPSAIDLGAWGDDLCRYRWRPVNGTGFVDVLPLFEKDPETQAIVMIGEIGGDAGEKAAEFIKKQVKKPVVSFIAGITAPWASDGTCWCHHFRRQGHGFRKDEGP